MKVISRALLSLVCLILLTIAWLTVLRAQTSDEKQATLMNKADTYTSDGIYILAAPLLEEATGYSTKHTLEAEDKLKNVYLNLIDESGYAQKYTDLLNKQMGRKDAVPDVFIEAANYYIKNSNLTEALTVLKNGIAKTDNNQLVTMYEDNRYAYNTGYETYDDVTAIYGTSIGVKRDEHWGLANSDGVLQVPCQYDKISTFDSGRAIVCKDETIYAIDGNNNRIALLKDSDSDFGNYADGLVPIQTNEGWIRDTGDFTPGRVRFEQIGMYNGGYAAAEQNGKWGVVDTASIWLIPPEYDGIITDELGRAYAQGAVFVKTGGLIELFVNGNPSDITFDDAKPFGDINYAAVEKNGKWGFIDTTGTLKIDYQFDDALSFGQHLAAVQEDGLWGYVSLSGKVVIDPVFQQAKSFCNGSAPVLTNNGWQFISLVEYVKGAVL